jgi:DNA-binding NtrC family response regulator
LPWRKLHRLSIIRKDPAFTAADLFDKGTRILGIRDQAAIGRIETHATGQLRPLRSIGDVDGIHAGFHLRPGFIDEQDLLLVPVEHTQLDSAAISSKYPLPEYLDRVEKQALLEALEQTGFNRTAAARLLGLTFRTMRYRMERLGIKEPSGEDSAD